MLSYVAGVADPEEAAQAEMMLSAAGPAAQADYAEALAVFHAIPLGLTQIMPPVSIRDALFGRIAADVSADDRATAPLSTAPLSIDTPVPGYASRFRWPVYVSSGLAACLAVALSMSLWNYREVETRNQQLADRNSNISATLAGSQAVMRSPHLTLASMETQDKSNQSFGRVLFCPVTKQYQVNVYGLKPLPPGKAYELWLITPDQRKVPAGMFVVDERGTGTLIANPRHRVDAANAAVTDEPAEGSDTPTGSIHLVGALPTR